MDLGLRDRAAFVAASSAGMGRAIAEMFAAEGADVGMCARGADALDEAAAAVRAHGGRAFASVADVADRVAITAAVAGTVAEFGRLDALVVNAGGPPPGTFADLDDAAWQRAHELTLMSAVHLVKAATPALHRSDAPSIVFVSSMSVRQPVASLVLSNSVRMSVIGLAKSLATELAPIRVNTLLPGNVLTGRTRDLARSWAGEGQTVDDIIAERSAAIPLARYGDPAEFAHVAVFMSSPAAAYVTGTVLPVDGGVITSPM
jgi:3-oxoacyl-[acyl-carrier protein] reductase